MAIRGRSAAVMMSVLARPAPRGAAQRLWFAPRARPALRRAPVRDGSSGSSGSGRANPGATGAASAWKGVGAAAAALFFGASVGATALCEGSGWGFDPGLTQRVIDAAWSGTDSYGEIPEDEEDAILETGAHWAYGEISFEGVEALLRVMDLTPNDVFFDLGSGRGMAVAHCFLSGAPRQSVGVEMSRTRHVQAKHAAERLSKIVNLLPHGPASGISASGNSDRSAAAFWLREEALALSPTFEMRAGARSMRLVHGDCLKVDLAGATAVYMANLTWPDEAVAAIGARLAATPSVRIVASLKPLPSLSTYRGAALKPAGTLLLPMSWQDRNNNSYGVPVYLYRRA